MAIVNALIPLLVSMYATAIAPFIVNVTKYIHTQVDDKTMVLSTE